jgi:hypothetical protein
VCVAFLQDALNAAGITPSNSRRYPVQDIKDAIEDKYGVMPHVTCDGQGELSEVRYHTPQQQLQQQQQLHLAS